MLISFCPMAICSILRTKEKKKSGTHNQHVDDDDDYVVDEFAAHLFSAFGAQQKVEISAQCLAAKCVSLLCILRVSCEERARYSLK